jgi:aminopeptidase N
MENQTLITLCSNCWDATTVAHEFSHQWFGDAVTCGTWADVWLNEGFATYCEALWSEYNGGYTAYKNTINSRVNSYFSQNPGWPIYNPQWAVITPNSNTLYNYAITYCKGAGVLHMLRYIFFRIPRSFLTVSGSIAAIPLSSDIKTLSLMILQIRSVQLQGKT